MKIIEEALKRKQEIEANISSLNRELLVIKQLLSFHPFDDGDRLGDYDGISVRTLNCLLNGLDHNNNRIIPEITRDTTMQQIKEILRDVPDSKMLRINNFGRKSLNEIKQILRAQS